jgi:hypothetical protein
MLPSNQSISVVTVCMNRGEHLLRSAQEVSFWPWHNEHVVIDWGSTVPLRREDLPADPRLRLLRVDGESRWNLSRAYNFGVKQSIGSCVLKMDADAWPTAAFDPQRLLRPIPGGAMDSARQMGFCAFGSGPDGRKGQFLIDRDLFDLVGGFNELLMGYGFDDKDLRQRLQSHGLALEYLPECWIGVIPHSEVLRVQVNSGFRCNRFERSRALALKHAQMLANRLAAAHCPWSAHQESTRYQQLQGDAWRADPSSVPLFCFDLAEEIRQARRLAFWSHFLAIPEVFLQLLYERDFPNPTSSGREVRWSHRLYWFTIRRFLKAVIWALRGLLSRRSEP